MPSTQGLRLTRRQLLRHSAWRPRPHRTAAPRARRHAHTHGLLSQPISEQTNVFAAQEFGWFREVEIEFTFVPGAAAGPPSRMSWLAMPISPSRTWSPCSLLLTAVRS